MSSTVKLSNAIPKPQDSGPGWPLANISANGEIVSFASKSPVGSGLHFEDDFQFDRRTEWKARDSKDKPRRDGLFAENIPKQLRRRIGNLRVFSDLRRR